MLDYRLQTFLILCQTKSFTKTSELLHLSQPAVSQQIKYLEQEFGVSLYMYSHKQFTLTESGKKLYEHILFLEQENEKFIDVMKGKQDDTFIVYATSIVGNYMMSKVIAELLQENPNLSLKMEITSTPEAVEAVSSNRCDCALIEGYFNQKDYECIKIKTASLVLCVPCNHPLTHMKQVTIDDILGYPLIVKEKHASNRGIFPHALAAHNLAYESFANVVEVGSITALKQTIIAGGGIGFLHKEAVNQELDLHLLEEVRVKDFDLKHDIMMVLAKKHRNDELIQKIVSQLKRK